MINLITHCGAHHVTGEYLELVEAPQRTRTHTPIPHIDLVDGVRNVLTQYGLKIKQEEHAVSHEGNRYFGLMSLGHGEDDTFEHVLGLRNSNDKRFSAGLALGSQVLVCDNLSFCGEVTLSKRHVSYDPLSVILENLCEIIPSIRAGMAWTEKRYDGYRNTLMSHLSEITVAALDAGIITGSMVPKVLKEYREPRHEDFESRTLWSWFNAVTEISKGQSLAALSSRTAKLHRLCDRYAQQN